jgi:hypothetical protein
MEWLWYDPDLDEPTQWWTIDPQSGQPDRAADRQADYHCLGESVLNDVGSVADALATSFVTKEFSDEEVNALIMKREVPASFRGGPVDAAELVEHVADLWRLAERRYVQALGRPPNQIERYWLCNCAMQAIRARGGAYPAGT